MIYYHSALNKPLNSLGIDISLSDQRAEKLFNYLQHRCQISNFLTPSLDSLTHNDLELVHSKRYMRELLENPVESVQRCYEGYCSKLNQQDAVMVRDKVFLQAYGTYEAMKHAMQYGFVYYLGGGMHHAMRDGGRGFCLINDIAIAIRKLQHEKVVYNVWIIDVDAHKGDGSAEIFNEDPNVKTLSIHMQNGWPLDGREDSRSFISSSIDIPIASGEEGNYLKLLEKGVESLLDNHSKPDLVCVVDGMDGWQEDELESANQLNLSKQQLLERDQYIFTTFKQLEIPQLYVMAGGYGENSWQLYASFIEWSLKV